MLTCHIWPTGRLTVLGTSLTAELFLLDIQGTHLDLLYCQYEASWWLPGGHIGPTWGHVAQDLSLILVLGRAFHSSGRGMWIKKRVDWYCGDAAMNSTVLSSCSCAAHISPGESFDRNAWLSLYGSLKMSLQSVIPSSRVPSPTQTSPSPRPVLLTSITRNVCHRKSKTVIQIFYSLVEDLAANCWEDYQISFSLMQPTCVKMKVLLGALH